MSISIDANIYLLCSMFNINYRKISNEYSGMSIDEIMEAEAEQGNTAAKSYDKTILNDPIKLIELMQLNDPNNKYAILSNLNEEDLDSLLPQLKENDLIQGLNYFTKEKLLNLVEDLPKDQLVNYTLQMFSPEHLMMLMPDEEINKVLTSSDMNQYKGLELKMLQSSRPEILAQMIEAATGEQANGVGESGMDGQPTFDKGAMMEQLAGLSDLQYKDALTNMPPVAKQQFMLKMTKEDPSILQMFDASAYTNIIGQKKEKQDMIKAASVIDKDQLVKMVQELPKELTAAVLTQIDTKKFADDLLSKFKNILSQIVAC